jgi:hypothetical protein
MSRRWLPWPFRLLGSSTGTTFQDHLGSGDTHEYYSTIDYSTWRLPWRHAEQRRPGCPARRRLTACLPAPQKRAPASTHPGKQPLVVLGNWLPSGPGHPGGDRPGQASWKAVDLAARADVCHNSGVTRGEHYRASVFPTTPHDWTVHVFRPASFTKHARCARATPCRCRPSDEWRRA